MKKLIVLALLIMHAVTGFCEPPLSRRDLREGNRILNPHFTKKLRQELKLYLVEHKDAGFPEAYGYGNLVIWDLLAMKNVDITKPYCKFQSGIYSFTGPGPHKRAHILLKNGKHYQILEMPDQYFWEGMPKIRTYPDVIEELKLYFKNNPDLDPSLLPAYINAVDYVYKRNVKNTSARE